MFLMMKSSRGDCRNPNINNNRNLPADYYIKAANLQPASTSMVRGTLSSTEQGRSTSSGCFGIDERAEIGAAPLRRSRWTPTPKQVMALEEMYRSGLKTPTAKQIQLVTAQLRHYGRIEEKNVFYWFQNHRARERQRRRRQLMSMYQSTTDSKQPQAFSTNNTSAGGPTKSSLEVEQQISVEVEQQNKWRLPNSIVIPDQESPSVVLQERMMSMAEQSDSHRLITSDSATLIHRNFLDYRHCYHNDYGMVLTVPTDYRREEESRETKTLELFPLKSDNLKGTKDAKVPLSRTTSTDDIISFFERIKSAYI